MRYCVGCGSPEGTVEFKSEYSMRCVDCVQKNAIRNRKRKMIYRNARLRAMTRLANEHKDEYLAYLVEEQTKEDESESESQSESQSESEGESSSTAA